MQVRAGGGVVWRRRDLDNSVIEVLLIHRERYDDWTLPKGKQDPGETDEQTALREVEEETGLTCELGSELPSTEYVDGKGRNKLVRYWAMTIRHQRERQPDDEVDDWHWASLDEADRMLSYERDRRVVGALREVVFRA